MREILFRGKKDDLPCIFVYGQLIVCDNGDCLISKCNHYGDTCYSNKVFPDTVGQFTGLTDKNGKKVFEGDVVRYAYRDEEGRNAEVVYRPSEFLLRFNEIYQKYPQAGLLVQFNSNSIEVIGNIYDNPELMEV